MEIKPELYFNHVICYAPAYSYPDLYEASIIELQTGLELGRFTSVDLTVAYLARIKEVNSHGPMLRAVIETNPRALEQAAALDTERRLGGLRSQLHGIPILVKDNIATSASEGMNTTAGSHALLRSTVPGDATVVRKLREAGAIILGKTNMCEWAHERGNLADGWSGRGGQTTNPYYPGATTFGSSSGSAVGAAIGLAAGALGTETDASIIGPASANNVVGIKPTVGLVSRVGIIPVSPRRDTIGPIARSVADAAAILTIVAGRDSVDNYTHNAPAPSLDYTTFLGADAIQGKRFGVPGLKLPDDIKFANDTSTRREFRRAIEKIRSLGGVIIDLAHVPNVDPLAPVCEGYWGQVLKTDLKLGLNAYLKGLKNIPTNVSDIHALIAYNDGHSQLEKPEGYEDQSRLIDSESTNGHHAKYWATLNLEYSLGREQGIDAALETYNLDALVLPSQSRIGNCLASIAGYPSVTVPLGFHDESTVVIPGSAGPNTVYPAPGLPFGISFVGTAFSEPKLIGFAYAYEQHTHARLKRRAYREAIPRTQLKDLIGRDRVTPV